MVASFGFASVVGTPTRLPGQARRGSSISSNLLGASGWKHRRGGTPSAAGPGPEGFLDIIQSPRIRSTTDAVSFAFEFWAHHSRAVRGLWVPPSGVEGIMSAWPGPAATSELGLPPFDSAKLLAVWEGGNEQ